MAHGYRPFVARSIPAHLIGAACGTLLLAACSSGGGYFERMEAQRLAQEAAEEKQHRDEIDAKVNALEQALLAGKVLVVTPVFNKSSERQRQRPDIKREDFAVWAEWQHTGAAGDTFTVGMERVPSLQVALGEMYWISAIEPGTYRLAGMSYEEYGRISDKLALKRETRDLGLGSIVFRDVKLRAWKKTTEWRPAVYTTDVKRVTYCAAVFVAHGGCAQTGTAYQETRREAVPAGWYDSEHLGVEDGLYVTVKPRKTFASFEAKPGEVILIDGIFAKLPMIELSTQDCRRASGTEVQCELHTADVQRLSASIDEFRGNIPTIKNSAKMQELLARAQYRPLKITAKAGWHDPVWGDNFYLESGKR